MDISGQPEIPPLLKHARDDAADDDTALNRKGVANHTPTQHHRERDQDDKGAGPSELAANETAPPAASTSQAQLNDDHAAANASRPRINARATKKYLKIMVVGESGLGKSTFIQNLFQSYASEGKPLKMHDGRSTKLADFETDPSSMCTPLDPIIVSESLHLHISIQDTPGYGDDMNIVPYLRRVVEHIQAQRQKDFVENEEAIGNKFEPGCLEHSVTICLYFLPPHRAKRIDLILLAALSKVVPTLPVIAKADSMVEDELKQYRSELQQAFTRPGDSSGDEAIHPAVYHFSDEHLEALGVTTPSDVTPFAVIASTRHPEDEPNNPHRVYKWGTASAVKRAHSDTILLKRLLTGDTVDSFWELLDDSLKHYRAVAVHLKQPGNTLQELVDKACEGAQRILEKDQKNSQQEQAQHVQKMQEDIQKLGAELSTANANNSAIASQLESAQAETERLKLLLSDQAAELATAKTEAEGLRTSLSEMQAELAQAYEPTTVLNAQLPAQQASAKQPRKFAFKLSKPNVD